MGVLLGKGLHQHVCTQTHGPIKEEKEMEVSKKRKAKNENINFSRLDLCWWHIQSQHTKLGEILDWTYSTFQKYGKQK